MTMMKHPELGDPRSPPTLETERLAKLRESLAAEPDRFEPSTAFRVAATDPSVRVASVHGVSPAPVAVVLVPTRGGGRVIRTPIPGLVGPLGVLPPLYDEAVMREERGGSHALLSFLDVFGARIVSLFVEACEKYRLARRLRWGRDAAPNAFVKVLFSLAGLGPDRLREVSPLDMDVVLRFSGFFAQRTRNAASLSALLREYTGVPVEIELFRPRWLTVAEGDRSAIGQGVRLGHNAMAGAAVRDRSSTFRVVLGPLGYDDYLAFAPGEPKSRALVALTRLFVGAGFSFDIQVVLKKEDVPFSRMGAAANPPTRLGWNSYARVAPARRDSREAVYTAEACEREGRHAA